MLSVHRHLLPGDIYRLPDGEKQFLYASIELEMEEYKKQADKLNKK